MAIKIDGKIGALFIGEGGGAADFGNIICLTKSDKEAIESLTSQAEKLAYANGRSIESVYFMTKEQAQAVKADHSLLSQYRIWHRYSVPDKDPVPYDSTCTAVFIADNENSTWTVNVYKNYGTEEQEDITDSLDYWNIFMWYHSDTLPNQEAYYLNSKKYTTNVAPTSLKDTTLGKYTGTAAYITSKAGGFITSDDAPDPSRPWVLSLPELNADYGLNLDDTNGVVWLVVEPNKDVEITRITAPMLKVSSGAQKEIRVLTKDGIGVYNGWHGWAVPAVDIKTHKGVSYNYVPTDIADMSGNGKFVLKAGMRYFIRYTHPESGQRFYYRDGGTLGVVGYIIGDITNPNTWYDTSSWIFIGDKSNAEDMFSMNENEVSKYTGDTISNIFDKNGKYRCTSKIEAISTDDIDTFLKAAVDTKVIWIGESLNNGWFLAKYNSYIKLNSTDKYIGNFSSTSTGLPDYTTLNVGDVFVGSSHYNQYYTGLAGYNLYEVTNVETGKVTVSNITESYFKKDVTIITNSFTKLDVCDVSSKTINTDRKYEFLMT